jgi:hypothetical protein
MLFSPQTAVKSSVTPVRLVGPAWQPLVDNRRLTAFLVGRQEQSSVSPESADWDCGDPDRSPGDPSTGRDSLTTIDSYIPLGTIEEPTR